MAMMRHEIEVINLITFTIFFSTVQCEVPTITFWERKTYNNSLIKTPPPNPYRTVDFIQVCLFWESIQPWSMTERGGIVD